MCSTSLCIDGGARSALLLQARKGDHESLAKLILPYAPGLYLGALRLTRNAADAEDVRQAAFLKAMTRLEQFAGTPGENRDDLHAWVSRIAANASIDVIRKRRDGKLFSLDEPSGAGEEMLGSTLRAARNAQADGGCDQATGSGYAAGVPLARRFAVFDAGSCRAAGDFGDGGAAQALSSAPETPGKAERDAAAREAEASARGSGGRNCAARRGTQTESSPRGVCGVRLRRLSKE